MKITVHLSKAELDLVEEALIQYQNLLLKSESVDEVVKYELSLCQRVFEEFGMEDLSELKDNETAHEQTAATTNRFPSTNQYPFSR
ncbi:hypothetical protein SAMN05444392_103108 [Seinonella peptonophila]|uniref:Uncharacterized protein n=1 Tax=Seinonella peptonophila TaxID=112248 RepID=A0A1M4W9G1_9BACL|nr:hypothetical protein [Seinonella peptonophila]SHE77849.1 hypothetical protein SAMN05444392_103108 [Seinonella peptonophila]